MAGRLRIILVIVLSLMTGGSSASAPLPAESPTVYLAAGIGIEGIAVGYSTRSSVIAKYGNDFKLTTHQTYSHEMSYPNGVSFFYLQSDPDQKIFCIAVKPPCRAFTSRGIEVGRSTLRDVFKAYGETNFSTSTGGTTRWAEYPGIHFIFEHKENDDVIKDRAKMLKRKVVEIEIVPFGTKLKSGTQEGVSSGVSPE